VANWKTVSTKGSPIHVWPFVDKNFLIYGMNHYRFGFFLQKPPKNDRS